MASVEEQVEDFFKKQLSEFGIKYQTKTEPINRSIDDALSNYCSKSGGSGKNYPDIKLLLTSNHARSIPVMIEAKGTKGDLIKYAKDSTEIELVTEYSSDSKTHKKGDKNYTTIQKYAVNGAVHYANAILYGKASDEVIAIGVNGYTKDDKTLFTELEAYYVSNRKARIPIKIGEYKDLGFLKKENIENLFKKLDDLTLSEEELEKRKSNIENDLESKIKSIHQSLYDDSMFKSALRTNEKLYLFCGLIMAGLPIDGIRDFDIDNHQEDNDGQAVIQRIQKYLEKKNLGANKKNEMIIGLLKPVFDSKTLNSTDHEGSLGESLIKRLYIQIQNEILPYLTAELHLDFTGKIMNSLNDWVHLENDKANDVVLTPRYVTSFMAKLAHTDMDSYVWDCAMGSAGFLVAAMELMIRDAESKIVDDPVSLEAKKRRIKKEQILGIEILGNVYILACLNMFLMGDGSSNIIIDNTFECDRLKDKDKFTFPATVFLLNPPYSEKGKGFNFVEFALDRMTKGYGCILIQENAGSGNGLPITKNILNNNTLVASIHMPADLFMGKASVQAGIYLFKVNQPHDPDSLVTFIDMSEDGYSRQNRKKSSQAVNLRDTDNAKARYEEVVDIILNKKPKTCYYTEANGLVIRDTISLDGNDWTFAQHKKIDIKPTLDDFKKTVKDFLSWKVSQIIQQEDSCLGKM
jgi:hypothetical protein